MTLDFELLYNIYTQDFISLVRDEDFYTEFMNKAKSGNSEVSFMHRFVDKQIDIAWVEAIEDAIIPLDNIIRNPRRFIVQEEEIVNIELARKISPESIRHLAQHTNMIAKVEDDTVTPNRILNIFKEESFETYENRFIYTLLINLQYFISKRLKAINDCVDGNNVTSILFRDNFSIGRENVKCSFEMTIDSPGFKMDGNLLDVDPEKLSKFQRIERIKKILYDFQNSPLIKALHGTSLVRPPIMRTNVLQKNPDFKKAKALWDFIETYRESGFNVEITETNEIPNDLYLSDLYSTMVLNYSLLKHHIGSEGEYEPQKKRKVITPKIIERTFMDVLDDLTFDIDVVQKIFNEQVVKSTKKRQKQEREVLAVIDRAIDAERKRREAIEAARLAILEAEKAERRRIREEQRQKAEAERQAKLLERQEQERLRAEAKAKAEAEKLARQQELQRLREEAKARAEAEKLARQQAREEAKAERLRLLEEEKQRIAEEKRLKALEKEAQQKALEKEKALEKKRKEREALKRKKQKEAEAEKERLRKSKEQQRLREKKASELQKQKEAEAKRREQEKQKARKEKELAAQKEAERKQKEKEAEKLRKERELAKQKEAETKRKEQEKLKAQREKEALAEKERRLKEQEKLRVQKEKQKAQKEKEALAEKERRLKEQEKLKAQKEKEALAEKERQHKAREQQKLKEMKAKELARQKEAEAKRKEKEKLRLQKEKEALAEKERQRKEKERRRKELERQKLKEKEAEIRAREKAKIEALRKKSKEN